MSNPSRVRTATRRDIHWTRDVHWTRDIHWTR